MRAANSFPSVHALNQAISVIAPLIGERVGEARASWCEAELRKELVGCVLGSQVRHEMAMGATENLEWAGLLSDAWWTRVNSSAFETRVVKILSGRARGAPYPGSYRFPALRSAQLARARDAIARLPLVARFTSAESAKELRSRLISDIPGLGPKQASMFLRNVGRSFDLAILDTHVLAFIQMQNLCAPTQLRTSNITQYEAVEQVVVRYAESRGQLTGHLDWAIWITMKAARELRGCRS